MSATDTCANTAHTMTYKPINAAVVIKIPCHRTRQKARSFRRVNALLNANTIGMSFSIPASALEPDS
jgi:hypothetical protein